MLPVKEVDQARHGAGQHRHGSNHADDPALPLQGFCLIGKRSHMGLQKVQTVFGGVGAPGPHPFAGGLQDQCPQGHQSINRQHRQKGPQTCLHNFHAEYRGAVHAVGI